MSKMTKLIAAVTGLLVAVGTLVGTISMTIGKGPEPACRRFWGMAETAARMAYGSPRNRTVGV